ncbi:MAG: EipB family protein [Rhabdaerophilum sp.]
MQMHIGRREILGSLAASFVLASFAAEAQSVRPDVTLQPHRIAYEVSLGPKGASQSISGARGLMVLEFTGSACDGYATNFRQVVELLDSDGSARNMDFRVTLFEDADAKRFRFAMLNRMQGQVLRDADGEARRRADGSLSVVMKKPAGKKTDFDGDVLFPSAMTIAMIEAAQKGARSYQGKVFDGSESGEKVFDVNATIGNKLEGERNQRIEEILRTSPLSELPRWPMTMTYYNDEVGDKVPVYTLRAVVFANGVMGDMNFQFPDFSLLARAVKYEALKADTCTKP